MEVTNVAYSQSATDSQGIEPLLFSKRAKFSFLDADMYQFKATTVALDKIGAKILSVETSGHEISVEEDDYFTIMFPLRGVLEISAGPRQYTAVSRDALAFRPSNRFTRVTRSDRGPFHARMIKLPVDIFDADQQVMENDVSARGPCASVDPNCVGAITALIDYIMADLASDVSLLKVGRGEALSRTLFMEHLRLMFQGSAPRLTGSKPSNLVAKAREAEQYMRENFAEPLSVVDIARTVGVGPRTLHVAFQAAYTDTPWNLLSRIRLEEARTRLLNGNPGETVTTIALDCGFTHMSRFSGKYREAFGELPSVTLKRSRW